MDEIKFSHDKECEAYALIKDIQNFPTPEIYYIQKISKDAPGVIVMEVENVTKNIK
jgi:hypothetical protein